MKSGHLLNVHDDVDFVKAIYNKEVESYLKAMDIPKGIAHNESLKENIFVILVSICNGIPVIISGKPGCSKTLAVNLIQSHMNGKNSKHEFFKRLPRIYFKSYQGSLSSSSEEIVKVFESAYKKNSEVMKKEKHDQEKVKIVVFFDELGLAEISKNHPLKVLHSLLEPDMNEKEKHVGFVGISNWRLDASKINRVVYLAKPDPEELDLKKTAIEIALSYGENLNIYKKYFEDIAKYYYEFKENLRKKTLGKEEFHGTRDFYSCVKLMATILTNNLNVDINKTIYNAVARNFGGLEYSADFLPREKFEYDMQKVPCLELIKQNLGDTSARYLMMITMNKGGLEIISGCLKNEIRESVIIVGSSFEQDLIDDEYSFRILSSITDCTEKGKLLILQNLDMIYPTLYDLFNQNFKVINKEKRCRIALGNIYIYIFI